MAAEDYLDNGFPLPLCGLGKYLLLSGPDTGGRRVPAPPGGSPALASEALAASQGPQHQPRDGEENMAQHGSHAGLGLIPASS